MIVEQLVLAQLVVQLDEFFHWLPVPDRVSQSVDYRGRVVRAIGLCVVELLLDDAKFLQIARVLAGACHFVDVFLDVLAIG